jgi:uncharacterized protein (TIGR03435 family)
MQNDDLGLLREYVRRNSEDAFATLVSRYVNLVYSVALRVVGDPHLAEEVTQAVFIILARKAEGFDDNIILSGWLCRTARYAAANALTVQRRRRQREQEAQMQNVLNEPEPETWRQIAPLLDGAMEKLGRKDHDALVLRFFENKDFAEVGAALGASEDAAKMRVGRALEKLRNFFSQRGISSTTAILAGEISANSVQTAPVALAKSVTAVALAKGAAASASTLTLINGALKLMAWTKAKTAIVAATCVLLAAGTTTITLNEIQQHRTYSWQNLPADSHLLDKLPPQVKILHSKYSDFGICSQLGKTLELGASFKYIVAAAYDVPAAHVVFSTTMIPGRFDLFANLPDGNGAALQQVVRRQFGLLGKTEVHDTDVLLLKVKNSVALQAHVFKRQVDFKSQDGLQYGRSSLAGVAGGIEMIFEKPVIDSTGLSGDYHLQYLAGETNWDSMQARLESVQQRLSDELSQTGLELVPTNMPVEMLVVSKAP